MISGIYCENEARCGLWCSSKVAPASFALRGLVCLTNVAHLLQWLMITRGLEKSLARLTVVQDNGNAPLLQHPSLCRLA